MAKMDLLLFLYALSAPTALLLFVISWQDNLWLNALLKKDANAFISNVFIYFALLHAIIRACRLYIFFAPITPAPIS